MAMEKDQEFLYTIVKMLVDHPDDVNIDRTVDERGVLLTLTLNREDMGKIIGKEGRTAGALRTLLRTYAMKFDIRANLKINEPDGSESRSSASDIPSPSQAVDEAVADLKEL